MTAATRLPLTTYSFSMIAEVQDTFRLHSKADKAIKMALDILGLGKENVLVTVVG